MHSCNKLQELVVCLKPCGNLEQCSVCPLSVQMLNQNQLKHVLSLGFIELYVYFSKINKCKECCFDVITHQFVQIHTTALYTTHSTVFTQLAAPRVITSQL